MRRFTKVEVIEAARNMPAPPADRVPSEPHRITGPYFTKEGIKVKVGQVWEDLDPRMGGRTRRVVAIEDRKVVMAWPHDTDRGRTKVSISRMHKSSTGWKLVSQP